MKAQGIISIVIGIIGFVTFTVLLVCSKIGVFAYCSLLGLLALVCIVVPVLGRLQQLDLKNLKLTLSKIEAVKKEIYAKEESLKKSSHVLAELIAATSALSGVWGDEESKTYSGKLISVKLHKLSNELNFTSDEIKDIFKYEEAINKVLAATELPENTERWEEFKRLLKSEAGTGS